MSVGTVRPTTFEWIIPNYQEFLKTGGQKVTSPEFDLPDSTWCLVFDFPFVSEESIMIYLRRRDSGPPKSMEYAIKTSSGTEVTEVSRTHKFVGINSVSEPVKLTKKQLAPTSDLLITCYINYSMLHQNADAALLSEQMKELLIGSSDHDITICVQDKKFRAHRNILCARSPVFAMMLRHDTKESNTSTIHIEDCDPESFDEFLLYVYSGRTGDLTPSNAVHLYYSADKYDFPGLKERCVSLLKNSLSVESFCEVVILAAKHQEEALLEVATEFLARNMKKVLVTVAWQKFMVQHPVEANELILKGVEIIILKTKYFALRRKE